MSKTKEPENLSKVVERFKLSGLWKVKKIRETSKKVLEFTKVRLEQYLSKTPEERIYPLLRSPIHTILRPEPQPFIEKFYKFKFNKRYKQHFLVQRRLKHRVWKELPVR